MACRTPAATPPRGRPRPPSVAVRRRQPPGSCCPGQRRRRDRFALRQQHERLGIVGVVGRVGHERRAQCMPVRVPEPPRDLVLLPSIASRSARPKAWTSSAVVASVVCMRIASRYASSPPGVVDSPGSGRACGSYSSTRKSRSRRARRTCSSTAAATQLDRHHRPAPSPSPAPRRRASTAAARSARLPAARGLPLPSAHRRRPRPRCRRTSIIVGNAGIGRGADPGARACRPAGAGRPAPARSAGRTCGRSPAGAPSVPALRGGSRRRGSAGRG